MTPIKRTQTFESPADKVWAALTNKQQMKKWYFDIPDFELKEGAVFNFYESEARQFHHRGTVKEVVPNQKLSHTWTHPSHSKGESLLTWELQPQGDKTIVTLTHEGIENFADAGPDFSKANYEMGWDAILNIQLRNHLYGIEKLAFPIDINAPVTTVWQKMWNHEGYKQWTAPFCEGSYAEGNFTPGSDVRFLTPDGSGMYSKVLFVKENEKIIFSHIGEVKNGANQPLDAAASKWTGSLEAYTYTEQNGGTHLLAEVDCDPKHIDYMKEKFLLAMQEVKKMSEG